MFTTTDNIRGETTVCSVDSSGLTPKVEQEATLILKPKYLHGENLKDPNAAIESVMPTSQQCSIVIIDLSFLVFLRLHVAYSKLS